MVWSESRKTWGQMQSDPYIKEKTICRGARCCRQCDLKTAFHLIHFHSILGPSINSVVKQLWKLLSRPRQCLEHVGEKKTGAVERDAAASSWLSVTIHMLGWKCGSDFKFSEFYSKFGKSLLRGQSRDLVFRASLRTIWNDSVWLSLKYILPNGESTLHTTPHMFRSALAKKIHDGQSQTIMSWGSHTSAAYWTTWHVLYLVTIMWQPEHQCWKTLGVVCNNKCVQVSNVPWINRLLFVSIA